MTANAETEPVVERFTETWIFGGSRVNAKGKRCHAWIVADGRVRAFQASGSFTVGAAYTITVGYEDGSLTTMYGTPKYNHDATADVDDKLATELRAKHRAAEIELQRDALERRTKRDDPLARLLDQLADIAAGVPVSQRDGFAALVLRTVNSGWYKPKEGQ